MKIIEIISAEEMAEKTTIGLIERMKKRQQEQIDLENAFCKLIEKINQEIVSCAEQGFKYCNPVVMELDYWGIESFEEDMNKIVEIFTKAGYDIGWCEYSLSWTHRSGKRGYFRIEW